MSLSVDIARSTEPRFPAVNPGDPQRFSCRGMSTLSDIGRLFDDSEVLVNGPGGLCNGVMLNEKREVRICLVDSDSAQRTFPGG